MHGDLLRDMLPSLEDNINIDVIQQLDDKYNEDNNYDGSSNNLWTRLMIILSLK